MHSMRTTVNLAEDALLAARHVAQRERMSLGEAVSTLIRRGAMNSDSAMKTKTTAPLRGRFALLPEREEIITTQHVRDLMEREGI
jgi:hypothetical protein